MQNQASRHTASGLHAGAPHTLIGDVGDIFALVADELIATETQLHDELAMTIPAVAEIGHYLAKSGGKRFRPMLTALGAKAVGFEGSTPHLCAIGELLHLGSLLHDDVVDDGQERRGKKAAQRVYGNPAVILTGDYCVARGLLLAAEHGGLQAVTKLAWTVTAMSEGEVTQLLNRGNMDLDIETYMDIVYKKSATLIAWCAAAGAWATEDTRAAEALYTYGLSVGTAFQITDDVLDYTGEKATTGKRRGQDLAERKITLPLLIAMDRVDGLRQRLAVGDPSPERIPALLKTVQDSGATHEALGRAKALVDEGLCALEVLPDSTHRAGLIQLAHHLVDRLS
jgi:octaprenyl-diphosphate synthase